MAKEKEPKSQDQKNIQKLTPERPPLSAEKPQVISEVKTTENQLPSQVVLEVHTRRAIVEAKAPQMRPEEEAPVESVIHVSDGFPWEKPSPLSEFKQFGDIPPEILPPVLRDHVEWVSRATQTSSDFALSVILPFASTCVMGQYVIRPRRNEPHYHEELVLRTLLISPSGTKKSPNMGFYRPKMSRWGRDIKNDMETQLRQNQSERTRTKKTIENLENLCSKLTRGTDPDGGKRQRLVDEINDLTESMPVEIIAPTLLTENTTSEALVVRFTRQREMTSMFTDEASLQFEITSGMYGGVPNTALICASYDGSSWQCETKNNGTFSLERPLMPMAWMIQDYILEELGKGSKKRLTDTGMMQRFMFFPEPPPQIEDVEKTIFIPEQVERNLMTEARRLLKFREWEYRDDPTKILSLSPEALGSWNKMRKAINRKKGKGNEYEFIPGWIGKFHGLVLRLAGVFHLWWGFDETDQVSKSVMDDAIALGTLLIPRALKSFNSMMPDKEMKIAVDVLAWIKREKLKGFTQSDCYQSFRRPVSNKPDAMKAVLDLLEDHNIIHKLPPRRGMGRRSDVYVVNPQISY